MTITTIGIAILIYLAIGCSLSFAIYDGGKHSLSVVFFYPLEILFFCLLAGIVFFFNDDSD